MNSKHTLTKHIQDSLLYKKVVEFAGLYSKIHELEEKVRSNNETIVTQQRRIAVLDDAREGEVVINKGSKIASQDTKSIKEYLQSKALTPFALEWQSKM
jgi:DNA-directed RNA polymerase subunit L